MSRSANKQGCWHTYGPYKSDQVLNTNMRVATLLDTECKSMAVFRLGLGPSSYLDLAEVLGIDVLPVRHFAAQVAPTLDCDLQLRSTPEM